MRLNDFATFKTNADGTIEKTGLSPNAYKRIQDGLRNYKNWNLRHCPRCGDDTKIVRETGGYVIKCTGCPCFYTDIHGAYSVLEDAKNSWGGMAHVQNAHPSRNEVTNGIQD